MLIFLYYLQCLVRLAMYIINLKVFLSYKYIYGFRNTRSVNYFREKCGF